jgi:hypothetical protein
MSFLRNVPPSVKIGAGVALAAAAVYAGYKINQRFKAAKEVRMYQSQVDANTGLPMLPPGKVPKALPSGLPQATFNAYSVADQLAIDLGTAFESWDPRRWTENDQEVYETLLTLNASTFPVVEKAYLEKYGRNLRIDVKKNLDRDLLAKVKYLS